MRPVTPVIARIAIVRFSGIFRADTTMLRDSGFSGFADDIPAGKAFYADVLGLR